MLGTHIMTTVYSYRLLILETYLDMLGHVNHATYLTLLEEARWDLLTKNGHGLKKIMETGFAPTILEVNIRYLKEIRLREEIIIETQLISFSGKIGRLNQRMLRGEDICCVAEFTFGLFDLGKRKLIDPSEEWRRALGIDDSTI